MEVGGGGRKGEGPIISQYRNNILWNAARLLAPLPPLHRVETELFGMWFQNPWGLEVGREENYGLDKSPGWTSSSSQAVFNTPGLGDLKELEKLMGKMYQLTKCLRPKSQYCVWFSDSLYADVC